VALDVRQGTTVLDPDRHRDQHRESAFFRATCCASGRIVAADIQPKMPAGLERRLAEAGLLDRKDIRLAARDWLG